MHRQIGNAVPLPLARALGREFRDGFFKEWKAGKLEGVLKALEQRSADSRAGIVIGEEGDDDDDDEMEVDDVAEGRNVDVVDMDQEMRDGDRDRDSDVDSLEGLYA
jgi:DNA (cytosine-5)-methyltransferase 1